MKNIIVAAFFLGIAVLALADAPVGMEMSYQHLGGNIYRVYHTKYYDCGSPSITLPGPAPDPFLGITLSTLPAGGPQAVAQTTNAIAVQFVEVSPVAPGTPTRCTLNTATFGGVIAQTYYQDFALPGLATGYTYLVEYTDCCRSGLLNSCGCPTDAHFMYTSLTINAVANSSPVFLSRPVQYILSGYAQQISQAAYDPDGDSLVYELVASQQAAGLSVPYAAGFSPTTPLGPTWNVSLDAQTGLLTFLPNPGNMQSASLAIRVSEYRNGVYLGAVVRDVDIKKLFELNSSGQPANTGPDDKSCGRVS